MLFNLVLRLK